MHLPSICTFIAAFLTLGGIVDGQERPDSQGPVTLRETDSYRIQSRHVGAELEIRVARPIPGLMGSTAGPYQILFVTDGDLFFGMATEITRLQHQLFGELPPLLVVGIGYGTNDATVQGETRNRDLTPSVDARFIEIGKQMNPGWEPLLPEGERMGGADRLLDFIEQELKPLLHARYDIDEDGSTLFGSSLGGLFANYALVSRPALFDRYIVVSPGLWWDDELLFRVEEDRARTREDLAAKVYFAVGEGEEGTGIPGLDQWKMVTNTRRMADVLESRSYPSMQISMEVLPGESHTSAVPVGLTRGLRAVFRR